MTRTESVRRGVAFRAPGAGKPPHGSRGGALIPARFAGTGIAAVEPMTIRPRSNAVADAVQLARSTGPGSDRFFTRSLVDALRGGGRFSAIESIELPDGTQRVDFIFSRDGGANRDVVRALLDAAGRTAGVETWMMPGPAPARRYASPDGLAALLGDAGIHGLRVDDECVALANGEGAEARIRFADFVDVGAERDG